MLNTSSKALQKINVTCKGVFSMTTNDVLDHFSVWTLSRYDDVRARTFEMSRQIGN